MPSSAMLPVVVGAGLVAEIPADCGAAERADGAAAGDRGADRPACRRAAHRAYGLTTAHSGARGEAEHAGNRTKRYERLQHMHLLVKRVDRNRRLRCSRAAGRSRTGRESAPPGATAGCSPSSLPAGDASAETFPCETSKQLMPRGSNRRAAVHCGGVGISTTLESPP